MTLGKALPGLNGAVRDGQSFRDLIVCISQRSCSKEVDKIAGLLHFFTEKALPVLPVYKPDETAQQAWSRLRDALSNPWRFALATTFWRQVEWQGQLYPPWGALLRTLECEGGITRAHLRNTRQSGNLGQKDLLLQRGGPSLVAPVALPCRLLISNSSRPGVVSIATNSWTPVVIEPGGESSSGVLAHIKNILRGCVTQDIDARFESETLQLWPKFKCAVRVNFTPSPLEIYYLVPQICLDTPDSPKDPWDYIASAFSDRSTGHTAQGTTEFRFLVCKELRGVRSSWDGISYQKIGGARVWVGLGAQLRLSREGTRRSNLEKAFCERYISWGNWRQVLDDIHRLGPKEMGRNYGTRTVYSLIYEGPSVSGEALENVDWDAHEIISRLLDLVPDINGANSGGGVYSITILGLATWTSDKKLVSLLLDRGADINRIFDHDYGTAWGCSPTAQSGGDVTATKWRG